MKKLLFILMFLPTVLFSQTKLDSLIITEINEYRFSVGLEKVSFDSIAFKAASVQSDTMLAKGYVGHNNYGKFETLFDRYKFFGGNTRNYKVGEVCNFVTTNVKNNDSEYLNKVAKEVVNSWKKSEEHNKVLIDPDYNFVGVSSKMNTKPTGVKTYTHYVVFSTAVFLK